MVKGRPLIRRVQDGPFKERLTQSHAPDLRVSDPRRRTEANASEFGKERLCRPVRQLDRSGEGGWRRSQAASMAPLRASAYYKAA
jgi:hypothetical protein